MVKLTYILGSTRSGTSALRNALSETRYSGYGEGHLTPLLGDILAVVRRHREEGLGAKIPGNGLFMMRENVMLRHMFYGYERYLLAEIGSEWVMDKTPTINPILLAPELNVFHQQVAFLHCARRHVDNVQSKIKKFPDRTLEQHCQEWAACNQAWLQVRDRLQGNYLDFDFYDLATDPQGMGRKIGEYLELDEDEITRLSAYLVSQRPQAAATRDVTKFLTLDETGWSDEEKEAFTRICGPVGNRLGYGLDDYWLPDGRPMA